MRVTEIKLWGETAGYASWDKKRACAVFQYDPSFLDKGYDVAPLTMPLSSDVYLFDSLNREMFHGLPGMLLDSLPDKFGNTLIGIWMSKNKIPQMEFTPLDRLCYVGKRGMGALEYEPSIEKSDMDGEVDVDMLASLAAEVLQCRESLEIELDDRGISELMQVGISAGGAKAKAVIGLNRTTNEVRSGQLDLPDGFEHWLMKFDTEPEGRKKGYCRIEYAYHLMAAACGIDMMECRLLETDTGAHFMTKRFDRIGNEKVHIQTLCALAHYDFLTPGKYSYEDMMSVMRRMRMSYEDQEQMFRRMVFNVIMVNQDDHTKNFSFMLDKDRKWRLTPAYDMTYAFNADNVWIRQHQMTVNGKVLEIERNDIMEFAHNMNIRNAKEIVNHIVSVAGEWERYAKDASVPADTVERIGEKISKNI